MKEKKYHWIVRLWKISEPRMKPEDALSVVQDLIFEINGIPVSDIKPSDSLIIDLAMDSVELIDFIIRLEDIGVIIKESQLTRSLTVEQVSQMIKK